MFFEAQFLELANGDPNNVGKSKQKRIEGSCMNCMTTIDSACVSDATHQSAKVLIDSQSVEKAFCTQSGINRHIAHSKHCLLTDLLV